MEISWAGPIRFLSAESSAIRHISKTCRSRAAKTRVKRGCIMISASQHSPAHAPAGGDLAPPDPRVELQLFLDHLKAGRKQEANALLARILASDPGQPRRPGGVLLPRRDISCAEGSRIVRPDVGLSGREIPAALPESSAAGIACSEAERPSGCDGLPREGHRGRRPSKSDAG